MTRIGCFCMKILYITPWCPDPKTGGGRHCYFNLRSLCSIPSATIDYIGPPFLSNLEGITEDKVFRRISREYNFADKAFAITHLASTSLARLFKQFTNKCSDLKYDLVFIESTRCGFVFKATNKRTKTICNIHNVEAEYLSYNKVGIGKIISSIVKRSEMETLCRCDSLLAMHDEDIDKICKFYGKDPSTLNFYKHPVCSFKPRYSLLPSHKRDKTVFFSGSLDSKFNEDSIVNFVKICWANLGHYYGWRLRIAGRNPSTNLLKFCQGFQNIDVIPNPSDMEVLLRRASVLILPDLTGTGMKLRVAEALSLGIPVVGTKKGLAGYNNIDRFGFGVDTIDDMKPIINSIVSGECILRQLSEQAREVWEEHFMFKAFENRLHNIVEKTFGKIKGWENI